VEIIRLNVLGRFEALAQQGEEVKLPTRKAEILLTRLALSAGQSFPRPILSGMLWSDRGEQQARNSLRQTLSAIKKAFKGLDPFPLKIGHDEITAEPNAIDVDVLELGQLLAEDDPEAIKMAAQLARGDFLEGILVRDAVTDEWLREERSHYQRMSIAALETHLKSLLSSGDSGDACEVGEKLVRLEPVSESAWRLLMQAYCLRNERNHALMAFRRCAETLENELEITPSEETIELKDAIQAGEFRQIQPASTPRPESGVNQERGDSIEKQLFVDSGRPSIVILPFKNLVAGKDDDYFAVSLAEDLIDSLSKYRELIVIHPESAFAYDEAGLDLKRVASELDVGYVVKGTIRKSGEKIRIAVQLIEVSTGKTLWSKRMHRQLTDLFDLEDEIASLIATSLVSQIEGATVSRARRKPPGDLTAYDCVVRARKGCTSYERETNLPARKLLEKAIELDPSYAAPYAYLSFTYIIEFDTGWSSDPYQALEHAAAFARKAISLDEFDSNAQTGMGWAYLYQKKYDLAELHLNLALECNPNDEYALCIKSWLLALCGRTAEVEVCGSMALRLNPLAPDDCLMAMVMSVYMQGQYDAAITLIERMQEPDGNTESFRAACYAQLLGGEVIRRKGAWERTWPFRRPKDMNRLLEGLRKSGIVLD
jgi:TolB-like protein/Flp pilus assembly protein TadD